MNKIQLALAAFTLALTPTLGMAMCSSSEQETVASCAAGMMFDAKTRTCVPQTTS